MFGIMAGLKPMSDDRSDEDLGMARMSIETETNQDQMRGPYKALYAKDQGGVILQYKTSVIHRCEFVTEFNLPYDERVKLTARYIEPVIRQRSEDQTKLYSYEHMMHKYAFRTETSPEPLLNRKCHTIGIDQLFSTYSDGKIPKTVILSGNSGSGKSFTLQKIMLDWASGKQHSQNFDVIFLLKCEELMYFSEEMTLIELLSRSCSLTSDQISQMIRHSPERILFLIDGYNEFIYHPPSYSSHQYLGALPMDTLRSLLKGDILPESLLLVSTRSTAAETLNNPFKRPQRFTEMMGFSESGVVEYFQKFFQDEQLFRKAYECVKTNEMLLTACSVPLICWIVCLCLKKHLTDGKDVMRELKTITSIYVHFVSTVLEHHCQSQSVPALLKSLCQLAEKGMLENRVLFDEGTVFETGLDVDSSLFLCKDLLNRNDLNAPVYKFLHLSFQEFFSAVSYALLDEKAQQSTTFRKHQHFGDFIDGISNWISPVVLFLCGLSNEEVSSSLIKKLNWKAFRTLRQNLERKILKLQYPCRPLALHCLYELHQEGFVRAVLADWDFLLFAHISLRTTDCWALLYCLQCCPHIRQLNITYCELTADKLRILQPALCMCEKLRLTVNSLPEVGDLIQALFEQRLLRELHVQEEEYSGEGPRWSLDLSVTHGDSLLFVSCSEKNPLFPSLVKISLICPYSEISSIDWTLFLQRLDKSGNLAEDSSEFDEHVNLLLSSFHSICLKKIELGVVSLTESWASGIISLIQTCTGFSIKKKKYSVKSLFSSLSVSITDNDIRLSIRISKTSMPSLSKLSLICPHSEISIIKWKLFFQRVCTARKFSEGSSDFDEHVSLLLSCFDSVSLKKLKLTVLSLTESWASGINSFIQTCTGLQELSINEEEESDKSLFSSLSVSVRDGDLTLCLTGRHKLFSEICLTCAYKTCLIICRNILQIFCELPRCEPNSIDSDDMADAMLSCLGSVSELKRLNLMVFWLTEKLAFRILSLIQTSPILQEISVKESHQSCKSLFSSLNVLIRDGNVIMDVRHSWKFELLSKITLTYKHSALSSSDWKIFFQSFHKIIRYQPNSPEFEENVNGLFSFLYSLCGLKRVELMIFSLNKNWALRILSLIHKCSSLQEVCLNVAGLMLEEGLVLLRESLMDPRCTVIIEGRKCNNSIRPCTEEEWRRSCNEKVEICFRPNVLENLKIPNPEPPGLDLHPYQNCQSCVHIVDCNQWVQVEPSVCRDESVLKFRISTQPGHYECTRTRMRWVCDCDVTLQYHPVDGHFLTTELERLQYERIAPVIDVTVISGKLKEAHLPHYACLAKSDPCLKDAVKLLSKKDEGVYLQSVELTRFHAKIVQPSFSFTTLIINWIMQWEEHCNLLLYMRCKDPLILHVYFFPLLDTCSKEKVEQNEKSSLQISHPRPNRPFRMKTTHLLEVPGSSVHPIEGITFRRDIDPNFFKIKQDLNDVHMNLIREEDQTSVWTATIWKDELIQIQPKKSDPHLNREIDKALFFDKHRSALIQGVKNVKSTADKLCEQGIINEEQHSEITHPNLICQDSMRKIFSIVHSGGMMAKAKFIMILREEEPCLLADLTLSDSLP